MTAAHNTAGSRPFPTKIRSKDDSRAPGRNVQAVGEIACFRAGNGNCLLDTPDKIMERKDPSRLPGEDYSVNKQCELVFGNGSRICAHMVSDGKSHIFVRVHVTRDVTAD